MDSTSTEESPRWKSVVGWTCAVVLNAGVGCAAVIPLAMFAYVLMNTVGDWLGLTGRDTKFGGDGEWTEVTLASVLVLFCVGVYFVVNKVVALLLPKTARRLLWLVSAISAITPVVVVMIAPQVWTAIS
ncbi:hypothetical protein ACWEIJ_26315 [Lentzea sp. NPDC004789]